MERIQFEKFAKHFIELRDRNECAFKILYNYYSNTTWFLARDALELARNALCSVINYDYSSLLANPEWHGFPDVNCTLNELMLYYDTYSSLSENSVISQKSYTNIINDFIRYNDKEEDVKNAVQTFIPDWDDIWLLTNDFYQLIIDILTYATNDKYEWTSYFLLECNHELDKPRVYDGDNKVIDTSSWAKIYDLIVDDYHILDKEIFD